ncbi:hypothetical protein Fot_42532 [Forsythia ovata]|uniref:Uncharacterized protein n=1 Tax=Forsythia ovata TaxID=205694 RepID=A0ABD1RLF8_9LAMI
MSSARLDSAIPLSHKEGPTSYPSRPNLLPKTSAGLEAYSVPPSSLLAPSRACPHYLPRKSLKLPGLTPTRKYPRTVSQHQSFSWPTSAHSLAFHRLLLLDYLILKLGHLGLSQVKLLVLILNKDHSSHK